MRGRHDETATVAWLGSAARLVGYQSGIDQEVLGDTFCFTVCMELNRGFLRAPGSRPPYTEWTREEIRRDFPEALLVVHSGLPQDLGEDELAAEEAEQRREQFV